MIIKIISSSSLISIDDIDNDTPYRRRLTTRSCTILDDHPQSRASLGVLYPFRNAIFITVHTHFSWLWLKSTGNERYLPQYSIPLLAVIIMNYHDPFHFTIGTSVQITGYEHYLPHVLHDHSWTNLCLSWYLANRLKNHSERFPCLLVYITRPPQ